MAETFNRLKSNQLSKKHLNNKNIRPIKQDLAYTKHETYKVFNT